MADPAPETLAISWGAFHHDALSLAERLLARPDRPWQGIVAIARGGLIPAAILARELEIRRVETVCVASYSDRAKGVVTFLNSLEGLGDGRDWLVVDDLADSGETLKAVRARLPKALFVALYAKPIGQPQLDLFVMAVPQHVWIAFPWDLDPDGRLTERAPLIRLTPA